MEYSEFVEFMDFLYWNTHYNKGESQLYNHISEQFHKTFRFRYLDREIEQLEKCSEKEICYFWCMKWNRIQQENYSRLQDIYEDKLEKLFPNTCRIYKIVRKYRGWDKCPQ